MVTATSEPANPLLALSESLAAALARVEHSLIAVRSHRHQGGSGIHWRNNIFIAAEIGRHPQGESKSVVLPDGSVDTAEVVGRDPALDLVVLRLKDTDLPTVTPSSLDQLRVGHLAVAAGRHRETGLCASLGLISNLGGSWETLQGRTIEAYIRPDITYYPPLLGGALVDTQGAVIGMNLIGPRRQVVTLPAVTLDRVVDAILDQGHIRRGYLGIGLQPVELPQTLRQSLDLQETTGLMVINLEADGPAEQGGLLIGDILLQLDHHPVDDLRQVRRVLRAEKIGQPIGAQLIRAGQLVAVTITVGFQS
jgi:S1-C subfamily serine protease